MLVVVVGIGRRKEGDRKDVYEVTTGSLTEKNDEYFDIDEEK